jgi:rhodanese-related sulfurtransferase
LFDEHANNETDIKVCCTRGINSRRAVDYLGKLNLSAVSIKGGMNAYSKEIDPKVPKF